MKYRNMGENSRALVKEILNHISRDKDSHPFGFPSDLLIDP